MAVYVKISDVIKLMKELRNEGYKEVSFTADEESDPELGSEPACIVEALDPKGILGPIDCGAIEGRVVDE